MKYTLLVVITLLIILLASCQSKKLSQEEQFDQKADSIDLALQKVQKEKIDLIFKRLEKKNLFQGLIYIEDKGKAFFDKTYGTTHPNSKDKKLKFTKKSNFRMGAITQQFTAVAILKLIQKKKIKLNTKVVKILKKFPYKNITIKNLLQHTSGIQDYITFFYAQNNEMFTYASNQNVLSWLYNSKPKLDFKAGDFWQYSSTNYVILAKVIEKVSKKKYPKFLEEEIFKPLNMSNTKIATQQNEKEIPNLLLAYYNNSSKKYNDNFLNFIYGDKGLYSNLEDLIKWEKALKKDKVISQKSLKTLFTPAKPKSEITTMYSMGWHIKDDTKTYYQMGGWLGYRTLILRREDRDRLIIVLNNNQCPIFDKVATILDDIMSNRSLEIPMELF